jgi:hypothetical protein
MIKNNNTHFFGDNILIMDYKVYKNQLKNMKVLKYHKAFNWKDIKPKLKYPKSLKTDPYGSSPETFFAKFPEL